MKIKIKKWMKGFKISPHKSDQFFINGEKHSNLRKSSGGFEASKRPSYLKQIKKQGVGE